MFYETESFTFEGRYSEHVFQGIMPDTGAAGISTAGRPQFVALQKLDRSIQLNTSTAGAHKVRFGIGSRESEGTVTVNTPIGTINFQVMPSSTPFLLCLRDMDELGVTIDNLRNVLVQGDKTVPIVRKYGHPWFMLHNIEQSAASCHLTEPELRQLHRRFGHPSVNRLIRILHRAGHDVNSSYVRTLTKYCHHCQMNGKSPGRFRFTIKDDHEFNYSVIIDILFLDGKPVLHVVDSATAFQGARFLPNVSAKTTWEAL